MSDLYNKLNDDLKKAMIEKDHRRVSILKLLKSDVLYAAADAGSKDQVSDDQVMAILRKESKRRDEAAELYANAGEKHREEHERYEKEVIEEYLPEMLSEEEVSELVDKAVDKLGAGDPKMLGKIISEVKTESKGLAEGSLIARLAKERINK